MIEIVVSREIPRSCEDVFDRLVDFERDDNWMPRSDTMSRSCTVTSEGGMGVGARYEDRMKLGTMLGTVVEFVRPTRVVFHQRLVRFGLRLVDGHHVNSIEPTDSGCRVTWTGNIEFGLALLPMRLFGKTPIRREREAMLAALARSFESTPG